MTTVLAEESARRHLANRARIGDRVFFILTASTALIILLIALGLFWELTVRSWPAIKHNGGLAFLWNTRWDPPREIFGAGTFIFGTFVTSLAALAIATTLALLVAFYLVEIAPRHIAGPVSYMVELLASIPSVVYGLWGLFVLGAFVRDYMGPVMVRTLGFLPGIGGTPRATGLLVAIIIVAIMILPTVMAVSRDVIAAVPRNQREGIVALGATRWEMIRLTVFPYARPGILGASILGLARALGETLAVTLVIGNRVGIPKSIFDPSYTMASAIANQFTEVENDMHRASLLEVALLLLMITFIVNAIARFLVWKVTGGRRLVIED
jgi:phosphate transport system permease protein